MMQEGKYNLEVSFSWLCTTMNNSVNVPQLISKTFYQIL